MRLGDVFGSLRHSTRSLAQAPGFAAGVLATFALGIGVNTAIFSAAWTALLQPLPLEQPDRLVAIWETFEGNLRREVAPGNFVDWRRQASSLAGAAAYFENSQALEGGSEPHRVSVARVSTQFFDVLGPKASAGRYFHGGERGALAVVSAPLWERELGGGPIAGRSVRLDGVTYQVVGLAPASFDLPSGVKIWTLAERDVPPLPLHVDVDWATTRDARYLGVYARLAPGATIASANAELATIAERLEAAFPKENAGCGVRVAGLVEDLGRRANAPLVLLGAGALAILLIACSNVAGLLLARGMARRRELAIRAALGAGGGRLLLHVVTEIALLAAAGGALGLAIAAWAAPLLIARLPGAEIAGRSVGVTGTVALFAAIVTVLAALAAAATPALSARRVPPAEALAGGRGALGVRHGRFRGGLVVTQAALAVLLVASTLLIVRTLERMLAVDPGFDATRVTTVRLWAPSGVDVSSDERGRVLAAAVAAAAVAPGVEHAGATLKLPLTGASFSAGLNVEGREFAPGRQPDVCWRAIAGDYFRALGIRLVAGRTFEPNDDVSTDLVTVINQTMARQIWPGQDPLGRRLRTGLDAERAWVRVVGVVADTPQESLTLPVRPEMYRPLAQPNRFANATLALAVRTRPGFSFAALRSELRAVSPQLILDEEIPLADLLRRATARERLLGTLLGLFAALALVLAGLGLYGVLALLVAERRREMGVRLALGATASDLRALVLRRGLVHGALGLALGIPAALALAQLFRSWLWQVSPADPWSLAAATAALGAIAALAAWLPARRAALTDPAAVLREE